MGRCAAPTPTRRRPTRRGCVNAITPPAPIDESRLGRGQRPDVDSSRVGRRALQRAGARPESPSEVTRSVCRQRAEILGHRQTPRRRVNVPASSARFEREERAARRPARRRASREMHAEPLAHPLERGDRKRPEFELPRTTPRSPGWRIQRRDTTRRWAGRLRRRSNSRNEPTAGRATALVDRTSTGPATELALPIERCSDKPASGRTAALARRRATSSALPPEAQAASREHRVDGDQGDRSSPRTRVAPDAPRAAPTAQGGPAASAPHCARHTVVLPIPARRRAERCETGLVSSQEALITAISGSPDEADHGPSCRARNAGGVARRPAGPALRTPTATCEWGRSRRRRSSRSASRPASAAQTAMPLPPYVVPSSENNVVFWLIESNCPFAGIPFATARPGRAPRAPTVHVAPLPACSGCSSRTGSRTCPHGPASVDRRAGRPAGPVAPVAPVSPFGPISVRVCPVGPAAPLRQVPFFCASGGPPGRPCRPAAPVSPDLATCGPQRSRSETARRSQSTD